MAAELKIGIGADNSGLAKGLRDAEAQITGFVGRVQKLANIGEQLSGIGQKMTVGLTLPIVALGGAAIKAYGDIEALKKGLEAVTGSTAAANAEFDKLKDVAKLPGLGMEEAVKGSINLQAIGMDADNARKILSQFGNAVATVGKGKAEFERAIYGVQQLANTDFPLGEDLNIIKDALPQVSNLLKEAFGSSRSDELAKMGVTSKQVLDTITAGLEKLPRVTGGIKGAFENLGDAMKTNLARIGEVINKSFDISGIIDKITGFVDKAVTAFENLSPGIQKAIIVVAGLAAAAGPLLVIVGGFLTALPSMIAGVGALSGAMTFLTGPIGLVTVGIVGIVAAVAANWNKITPYLVRTANNFIELYNESEAFRGAVLGIGLAFEGTYTVIKSFVLSAYNTLKSFGKGVLNLFEGVSLMIRGAFNMDGDMVTAGWRKANEKVALSFDDLGGRIDGLNTKYKNLFNAKPLKAITAADLEIKTDPVKTADEIVREVKKGAVKATNQLKTEPLEIGIALPKIEMAGFNSSVIISDDMKAKMEESFGMVPRYIDYAAEANQASWDAYWERFKENLSEVGNFTNFLGNAVQTGLNAVTDTIADSFSAMGEAMASGGNILNSVGKAILGGVGNFLGALGKQMVQYGVAALAMSILSKMLTNPITAAPAAVGMIAAGAALSAISGAIKGTLQGGSGASASYGGGGGFSSAAGGSATYSSSYSSGGGFGEVRFRIDGNDLVGVLNRQQDKNTRLGG